MASDSARLIAATSPVPDAALADAYRACSRLARAHYENFPVASWLLPPRMRPHVAAIYAFARAADDFADEGDRAPAERHALLDGWLDRLHRSIAIHGDRPASAEPGRAPGPAPYGAHDVPRGSRHETGRVGLPAKGPSEEQRSEAGGSAGPTPAHVHHRRPAGHVDQSATDAQLFTALSHTIRACRLPVSLFDDLISAFRQDVTTRRYATWEAVDDYCRRSANPVGRLVLRVAGYEDRRLDSASDAMCTALQLANFWQDLAVDWGRGRLYVPLSEVEAHGARLATLDGGPLTPEWRRVLAAAVTRTRRLFEQGRAVCDAVPGRLRWELRFTWLGGMRVLDRIERAGFDVLAQRPTIGPGDALHLLWRAGRWTRDARGAA